MIAFAGTNVEVRAVALHQRGNGNGAKRFKRVFLFNRHHVHVGAVDLKTVETAEVGRGLFRGEADRLKRIGVKRDCHVECGFPNEIELNLRGLGQMEVACDRGCFGCVK